MLSDLRQRRIKAGEEAIAEAKRLAKIRAMQITKATRRRSFITKGKVVGGAGSQ